MAKKMPCPPPKGPMPMKGSMHHKPMSPKGRHPQAMPPEERESYGKGGVPPEVRKSYNKR